MRFVHGPEEVMELATDYYKTLFQQKFTDPRAYRCRDEVWSHTSTLIQPSIGEALLTPFIVIEMQRRIRI